MRSGALSVVTVLAALVVGGGFVALSPEGTVAMQLAAGNLKDCKDFPSQAAAQDFYRQHPADESNLDANDNGVACEAYTKYPKNSPRDETPKDVVDPPPPVTPTLSVPPAPSAADGDPIPVVTAPPNTDRPRSDVEK